MSGTPGVSYFLNPLRSKYCWSAPGGRDSRLGVKRRVSLKSYLVFHNKVGPGGIHIGGLGVFTARALYSSLTLHAPEKPFASNSYVYPFPSYASLSINKCPELQH